MTREDTEKLSMITHKKLYSDFGLMNDLPYALANTVANVYWRYFEQTMNSTPTISTQELATRMAEFEGTPGMITEFRLLPLKGASKLAIAACAFFYVNICKYRIPDVYHKTFIRCAIERLFRKHQDIPNLVRTLQLYQ